MQRLACLAVSGVLLAGPAWADATYKSRCWREQGVSACSSRLETEHSTTRTLCAVGGTSACVSKTISKEPPRPMLPPSETMTPAGVIIMRGMPR